MTVEFVRTEHGDKIVSGIGYAHKVRVLMRSPENILYLGQGLNAWTGSRSSSMSAIKTFKHGRVLLADMQSEEIRAEIVKLFGEGSDELAIKAFRARGKEALGTVLFNGGGNAIDFYPRFETGYKTLEDGTMVWEEPVDHPMLRGKFGYEHLVVQRRARAWLKAEGVDEWEMLNRLPRAMEAWGARQPTYREISDAREARMKAKATADWEAGLSKRGGFNKFELEHMVEHFAMANDPVAQSIRDTAAELLAKG
jgi:hypothetical protein